MRRLITLWGIVNVLASVALVVYPVAAAWVAAIWVDGAEHLVLPQVVTWLVGVPVTIASWALWDETERDQARDEIMKGLDR